MILKRKSKALLALTLALCLSVCLVPLTAQAAGYDVDTGLGGSIALNMPDSYVAKMREAGVTTTVEVYQVATVSPKGAYSPVAAFATEEVTKELVDLNLNSSLSNLTDLVRALIDAAEEAGTPVAHQTVENVALVPGVVDEEGNAVSNVIEIPEGALGMYLLCFEEQLIDGEYYSFSPLMLSVPALGTKEQAANGRQPAGDPEDGDAEPTPQVTLEWQYDYTVYLKPEVTPATGKVRIVKNLESFNATAGTANFVFRITVVDEEGKTVLKENGKPLYSDVVSLKLNAAGQGEIIVEDLPYGYWLKVEEIDAGGYTFKSIDPANGMVKISLEDEDVLTVTITNNGYTIITSNSVVNHYEHAEVVQGDGSKHDTWTPEQQEDSSAKGGLEQ